mgnify:CR=1 FL=1
MSAWHIQVKGDLIRYVTFFHLKIDIMKNFRILLLTTYSCCLLLFCISFFSCAENQEVISDSTKLIEPRTGDGVWPDSVFELHNEYIL